VDLVAELPKFINKYFDFVYLKLFLFEFFVFSSLIIAIYFLYRTCLASKEIPKLQSIFLGKYLVPRLKIILLTILLWIIVYTAKYFKIDFIFLDDLSIILTIYIALSIFITLFDHSLFGKLNSIILTALLSLEFLTFKSSVVAFLDKPSFEIGDFKFSLLKLTIGVIAFFLISWVCITLSSFIKILIKNYKRLTKTQAVLLLKTIRLILLIIGFIIWVQIIGIDITSLTIMGGALGIGIGFGLQRIFSNLVSGFFILFDDSIKVGDTIAIDNTYGTVTKLNARYMSLTTRDGKKHLIPNELLITEKIENWSFKNTNIRDHVKISVSYDSDLKLVKKLILEATRKADSRILQDPPPKCNLAEFEESAVIFDVLTWVNDPQNGFGETRDNLLFYIWNVFKKHNIKIPYPQRDIHILENKKKKV